MSPAPCIVTCCHTLLQLGLAPWLSVYMTADDYVKQQALLGVRFASGNLPSSLGSKSDTLVHWCHGAPGAVSMLCAAAAAYPDRRQTYLEAAALAANVVSQRGLLKKGFGICHGIGGNGLALFSLHAHTGDETMRAQATRFALFACHPACDDSDRIKKELLTTPDSPHSLFEGYAGVACLLATLLEPPTNAGRRRHLGPGSPWLM